jgi:hydrogenase maturation protein HypF
MSPTRTISRRRVRLIVQGRVQGVGFRPTLYREVTARGCGGSIRNTPIGVEIELEGPAGAVDDIVENFRSLVPDRARVDNLILRTEDPVGEAEFCIENSSSAGASLLPIPPDLATCQKCHRELNDRADRRSGYPFNTSTCCGPRFTIARAVPFDRPTSAMDEFPLGSRCHHEYDNPDDRRFHAQTTSCPECGPTLRFDHLTDETSAGDSPLDLARRCLRAGRIVAIKGLGGFHLACDATRTDTVEELRRRKQRPHKPLAIMVRDLETCRQIACPTSDEERLLNSPEAPIVLLRKRPDSPLPDNVAPHLAHVGVMLPYTPLHRLLLEGGEMPAALVMTSCNRSDEPIATDVRTVREDLFNVADSVLWNDRPIENRCDDSLVACLDGEPLPMRRSRGYVPEPIILEAGGPSVFATGAMWKNTFALTTGRRAFLSQHIGDVSDADNARHFADTFRRFSDLLRLEPEVVACDLHPDYPTTRFARALAEERDLTFVQVQHHHAHLVSCLAENRSAGPAIGVSMDGTGYGEDGCVWGGEFMVFDGAGYERKYNLSYVPMPGGEKAVLEPTRMALSHLAAASGAHKVLERAESLMDRSRARALLNIRDDRSFSPLTSSCGRLFDAVAAILGVRTEITYEGQAACELEAICDAGEEDSYEFEIGSDDIPVTPVIRSVCRDMDAGTPPPTIAARFHNTISGIIVQTCRRIREETGIDRVALSGGVMQNRTLLRRTVPALEDHGFDVLLQTRVPPNDGGICLGQAAVALARSESSS